MKNISALLIAGWVLGVSLTAQSAVFNQSQTANQAIPDGDQTGIASTMFVSTLYNQIVPGSLQVSLNISGSYNGDLYAYLTHGSDMVVLLNRVGTTPTDNLGYGDAGMNVTFADNAVNGNIHSYRTTLFGDPNHALGGPLTGTWSPDGRAVSPFTVTGQETPTTFLSTFNGVDPNGLWTLFVADLSGGDLHTLMDWSISAAVVPEPEWYGLGAGVLAAGGLWGRQIRARIRGGKTRA